MVRYLEQKKRNLLYALVASDFKIRYQGSVLGYLWSLIRPLSLFAVLYVVFAKFFRIGGDVPYFSVYLLLGIMLWNFFSEATSNGLSSLVDKGDMIRKVYTPKYAIVLAAVFSATINLVINLFVVLVFAIFVGVQFNFIYLLALPIVVMELIAISAAVSFLLASLYVKYRDVKYIWELLLQVAFYATPIIYPLARIPEKYHEILLMNPMAQIIQDARFLMITDKAPTSWSVLGVWVVIPFAILIALTVLSIWYFKTKNRFLAEEL